MKNNIVAFILLSLLFCGEAIQAQSRWIQPASTTDILNTVCFIDSSTGWVGGMFDDEKTGVIRKTTDGGSTWTMQTLPVANPVRKIVFVSPTTGYAACYHGTILKTVDGGETWVEKPSGTTTNLESIFFLNAQLGWACGRNAVLMTNDGGETWTSRTVPGSSPHFDIAFGNEKEGTLVGTRNECFTTVDGGDTWNPLAVPYATLSYFGVAYLSPSTLMITGEQIALSRDGGRSWQTTLASLSWGDIERMSFADSLTGWAVGKQGIFKSTDGGVHWAQQSGPVAGYFYYDVSTPDGIHAWTVGYHFILKISDRRTVSFSLSTLTASPAAVASDGTSQSTITLQAKDADGLNFTSSVGAVAFSTTAGTLSSVVDHMDGTYTAVLTSPMVPTSATITASLGGTAFAASATVQLGPSLSLSTITAMPEWIRADGLSTSTITIQIKDGRGNNLTTSAGRLVLATTAGSLESVVDHNNGSYTAVLRSAVTAGGMAVVTASLNGTAFDGSATVLFKNTRPVQPPLDTTVMPMHVGDKWFYRYVSTNERAFVVKEITDTTADGVRVVTVTKFYPNKKTITTENWSIAQGVWRINQKPVYVIHSEGDSVLNWAFRSKVQYLFNGVRLTAQKYNPYWVLHSSASSEDYRAAMGVGLYLSMSVSYFGTSISFQDTLFLLGAQLNGSTYGEFSPMITTVVPPETPAPVAPPNTPALVSPADAQTIVSGTVLLKWTSSGGPTSFRLQVSTGPSFSRLLVDDSLVTDSSYSWNIPAANTAYYWRVKAANALGSSDWSPAQGFMSAALPAPISPADGAARIQLKPSLTWSPVTGATSYLLQVATRNTFDLDLHEQSGITATSAAPFTLADSTTYFWRVAAIDNMGTGLWSIVRSFTTVGPDEPVDSSATSDVTAYALRQNFPNPCNAATNITFALPAPAFVRLVIWNALGEKVATLVSEELPGGEYVRQWQTEGFPSGMYYYRLQAGSYAETRRLVLVK